ncbi:hypothetical protein MKW98_002844 [Papaver atlanticum]|uniref:Cytochrome P450 n=1 Tax=Papaver atlanticum TaxID=357466 RepID=A0AAD4THU6_9MAGN|nr:hypothetical protein MKW98_002844 [Papaver atlanticum]
MNKYSKHIFRTSLLGQSVVVLCGLDGNKFLFSNENKLAVPWLPRSIHKMFPYSNNDKISLVDEAKKLRKILSQFLVPDVRQRCFCIMERVVKQNLATNWDNKRKVTVLPLAMKYTLCLICDLFLSIDDPAGIEELGAPLEQLRAGLFSLPIDLPGTSYSLGLKASKFLMNKLVLIVKQRKIDLEQNKAPTTLDLLSYLLLEVDDDGNLLDESVIASRILGTFIGAHEASATVITFTIKYLAELPGVYSEVQKEMMEIKNSKVPGDLLNWDDTQKMKYSWNVVCEVMRLVPPIQGTFREAIVDFDYKGFSVPKGWKLFWSTSSTHKNSDYFSEPERFDPARFEGKGPAPYTYIPFGGGPHLCPGKDLAKLQILVFMYHVVTKYKWETVLPDEEINFHPFPKPAHGLPILLQHENVQGIE